MNGSSSCLQASCRIPLLLIHNDDFDFDSGLHGQERLLRARQRIHLCDERLQLDKTSGHEIDCCCEAAPGVSDTAHHGELFRGDLQGGERSDRLAKACLNICSSGHAEYARLTGTA